MAKYTYSKNNKSIVFNNVLEPNQDFNGGPGSVVGAQTLNNDQTEVTIDLNSALVNAVEIHWNDAKLDNNTTITSTGDLLLVIKDLRDSITQLNKRIAQLEAGMVTVSNAVIQSLSLE